MVERQITHNTEQKPAPQNKKHAFRSPRQQHAALALNLYDVMLIEGNDTYPTEGKCKDLFDGMYKKTIYVKTWTGRTVSLETDLDREVETMTRQLEAKTGIPKDHQHLVSRGKVLKDNRTLKEYGISGGETIEMTAKLRGVMKHKASAPHQWIPKETRKGKSHISTQADLKTQNHRQNPMKRWSQQKNG